MIDSRHNSVFKRLLAELRAQVLEQLGTGLNFDIYNIQVGRLRGFEDALRLADDADRELSGEN